MCFNPRPPKRTLCLTATVSARIKGEVSIHVLRRGRCVPAKKHAKSLSRVSIHVLRRGRCVEVCMGLTAFMNEFQSTSSEEDVVSSCWRANFHGLEFQSTSSEEDVVSTGIVDRTFNAINVSIHVLRRGRCVINTCSPDARRIKFQSTSSEEDVVSPCQYDTVSRTCGFNPRPPKRTLCQQIFHSFRDC